MCKVIKLRKSGKSLIMTMPKSIAEMFNLKEGSQVEIEPFTSTLCSLRLKVKSSIGEIAEIKATLVIMQASGW
jgi:antitoxin component of MazEF toxin-antitoxin module